MGSTEEALTAARAEDVLQTIITVLEDKSVGFKRQQTVLAPCKHEHINLNWIERQNAQRPYIKHSSSSNVKVGSQWPVALCTVFSLFM